MPDRQESASFLVRASAHGLIYRLLRHIQKPDLLTPVSIFQFIFGPILPPEILQLVCHGDLSWARPTAVAGKDPKPVSESTHSPPTQSLAKQANSSVPSVNNHPATVATSLLHLPSGTVSNGPEPPGCVDVATAAEPDVHSHSAPAAAAPPAAAISSQAKITEGKAEVPATLLVLDFDWSMVEENSDTFVVRELGTWEAFQRYVLSLLAFLFPVLSPHMSHVPTCISAWLLQCTPMHTICAQPVCACVLSNFLVFTHFCTADQVSHVNQHLDQLLQHGLLWPQAKLLLAMHARCCAAMPICFLHAYL